VRFHIIRNARIENVGKSQSCMVSKLRIIWKQTVVLGELGRTSWGPPASESRPREPRTVALKCGESNCRGFAMVVKVWLSPQDACTPLTVHSCSQYVGHPCQQSPPRRPRPHPLPCVRASGRQSRPCRGWTPTYHNRHRPQDRHESTQRRRRRRHHCRQTRSTA